VDEIPFSTNQLAEVLGRTVPAVDGGVPEVGVVAIGLAITADRSLGMRVLGGVGTVAAMMVVWLAIDTVIASLAPANDPHWVWAEAQLWVIAVAVAVGWQFWLGRIGARAPRERVPA
jgi:hypothetical protein